MKQIGFDSVVNKKVKITPMNLLFPKEIIDELREMDIKEGWCFVNAVMVAKRLQEKGYEVDVVEGYYGYNKKARNRFSKVYRLGKGWIEHRWCKIGDYYFDPTYYLDENTVFSSNCFDYRAERLYYADDLIDFAHQVSDDYDVENRMEEDKLWCSSLNGARNVFGHMTYLAKIDEDCNYVKLAS